MDGEMLSTYDYVRRAARLLRVAASESGDLNSQPVMELSPRTWAHFINDRRILPAFVPRSGECLFDGCVIRRSSRRSDDPAP